MIVRGYANAMYRLGVRYEVRHNEAEAVRCYGKASHLGNEPARVRLLDVPLAVLSASPSKSPPAPDCRVRSDAAGQREVPKTGEIA